MLKKIKTIITILFFSFHLFSQNQCPEITNFGTVVNPGDSYVRIIYDLIDNENDDIKVTLKISNNAGKSFYFPIVNATGNIGYPVKPGSGKIIQWYFPDTVSYNSLISGRFIIKLIADDLHNFDIQQIVDQVDSLKLKQDVNTIQGIRHRTSGVQHLAFTKGLIQNRLSQYGLPVEIKEYNFTNDDGSTYIGQNIIGKLGGNYEETVFFIIDGHFDTVLGSPGADDNASAVAGVLEAARILSQYTFEKTIRFIGFDLEEAGIAGSRNYARYCIPPNEQLQGVINLEMIGYYNANANTQRLPAGFQTVFPEFYQKVVANNFRSDFAFNVANVASNDLKIEFDNCAAQYVPGLKVYSLAVAGDGSSVPDLRRSDHRSFWDVGYKALMITDGANFRNPYYHSQNDLSNTLNYVFMGNIVKTSIATLAKLAVPIHGTSKSFAITRPLSGTYKVGNTGDYLNLTSVTNDLRIKYVNGDVKFELQSDYNAASENIPIIFNKLMLSQSQYNVVIRPKAGITSALFSRTGNADNEALIIIDNVKNLKFDGRPGGIGTPCLTITNTRSSNPGPVFEFRNGSQADTLAYLTLKSNIQSLTGGVIVIGKTNKSSGNNNIVIEYCDITGNPRCGIYCSGTTGFDNKDNKINYCNIYDFFSPTEDPKGIYIGNNNSSFTITNNKFFQTTAKTFTQNQCFSAIHIDTQTGSNFTISGNKIGFSSQSETGNTIITGAASQFTGIWINASSESTTVLENNTISNINFSSLNNGSDLSGTFSGIFVQNGNVIVGSKGKGNLIGGNLTGEYAGAQNAGFVYGIKTIGSGTKNIAYNTIAGLSGNSTVITGISTSGTGNSLISSNTIRDLSASNNNTDYNSYSHSCQGIWISGDSENIIRSNTLFNISNFGNAITNVAGIYEASPNTVIEKNVLYNITNSSNSLGKTANGIFLTRLNTGNVSNNMIALGLNDNTEYRGICVGSEDVSAVKKIYFNTVCVGGNASGGNSFCMMRGNFSAPLDIRNNIFTNSRSGNGKHYAIAAQYTSDWTSNFVKSNSYYSVNSATLALWGNTDNNYSTWISNTGGDPDGKSNNSLPEFVNPANGDLHLNPANSCSFNGIGENIQEITVDFDGNLRQSNPDLGADEIIPTGGNLSDRWIGRVDNNWDNPGNWQCELAPLTNSNLTISENGNTPVISRSLPAQGITINSLTINPGAKLELEAGNSLTLNGPLKVNGTLVLHSPENSSASATLIDNGTISGDGSIIVERFLSGGSYHYISSPVQAGGNANSSLFTTNNNGTFNPVFYKYDESFNLPSNPEPFNSQALVAGWIPAHPGQQQLPENLRITQGYASYNSDNRMISFIGLTNTGILDIKNLSYTSNDQITGELSNYYDGWHLLGNPYPSYLDWNQICEDGLTNIDNGIYVWDGNQYAGYQNGVTVMSGNQGNSIAPMQGFFVHAYANSGEFRIRNQYRTHGIPYKPPFLKSSKSGKNLLKLKTSANGYSDYLAILFDENSTEEYDGNSDLFRLFSTNENVPHLYSLSRTKKTALSLNCLPVELMDDYTVSLGLKMENQSKISISVDELNNFNNVNVYFIDIKTDKLINLRNSISYEFEFNEGTVEDRFFLKFIKNNPPLLNKTFGNLTAKQGVPFSYQVPDSLFIDLDPGDSLKYDAIQHNGQSLPLWLNYDPNKKLFYGNPSNSDVGINRLVISASDLLGVSASFSFDIEVQNVNDPPSLQIPICDIVILEDDHFEFELNNQTFVDIDLNDSLRFTAIQTSGNPLPEWLNFDPVNLRFTGNPKNEDVGNYEITLSATDDAAETANDIFSIEVVNVNDPPLIRQSIKDQELMINEDYFFQISDQTFTDIDKNDQISLEAKLSNGSALPDWLIFDPGYAVFSGKTDQSAEYSIIITARDMSGAFVNEEFKLKVYSAKEIEELLNKRLSVFPNPTDGLLCIKIELTGISDSWVIMIKDINGKTVYQGKLTCTMDEFDLSYLAAGAYLIELQSRNYRIIKSLIIK